MRALILAAVLTAASSTNVSVGMFFRMTSGDGEDMGEAREMVMTDVSDENGFSA